MIVRTKSHSLILFLMMNSTLPQSTLFPYTTLFRSQGLQARRPMNVAQQRLRTQRLTGRGFAAPADVDRKSTRLNSSHRCISYAVFCLKKKTLSNETCAKIYARSDKNDWPIQRIAFF